MEHQIETTKKTMTDIMGVAEIASQLDAAHRYPRDVQASLDEARQLATISDAVAQECIYAIPRGEETIEGPSARLAEIVAHAWGNSRAGARIVDESDQFVIAQAVFHDLEKNVAITYEVQRRITNSRGRKYGADMIGVTANAACSIALRNAILKGVPKAFWGGIYDAARAIIAGDPGTIVAKRTEALAFLQSLGVDEAEILAVLKIDHADQITQDHIVTLRGLATAIRDGDTTIEQAFPKPEESMTDAVKAASTKGGA